MAIEAIGLSDSIGEVDNDVMPVNPYAAGGMVIKDFGTTPPPVRILRFAEVTVPAIPCNA